MNLGPGMAQASLPIQKALALQKCAYLRLPVNTVYLKFRSNKQIHDLNHKVMIPLTFKTWASHYNAEQVQGLGLYNRPGCTSMF